MSILLVVFTLTGSHCVAIKNAIVTHALIN